MLENAIGFIVYASSPAVLACGWIEFARAAKDWTAWFILSLIAQVLASISASLAVGFLLHAPNIKGIWIFDPLASSLGIGVLTSSGAVVFAFCGAWKRNPLRWPALISAVVGFPFWFAIGASS
jgi:hypothetical protein